MNKPKICGNIEYKWFWEIWEQKMFCKIKHCLTDAWEHNVKYVYARRRQQADMFTGHVLSVLVSCLTVAYTLPLWNIDWQAQKLLKGTIEAGSHWLLMSNKEIYSYELWEGLEGGGPMWSQSTASHLTSGGTVGSHSESCSFKPNSVQKQLVVP